MIWSVAYDRAKREKKKKKKQLIISPTTLNTPKRKKERKIIISPTKIKVVLKGSSAPLPNQIEKSMKDKKSKLPILFSCYLYMCTCMHIYMVGFIYIYN
jgi:hypothetical protein